MKVKKLISLLETMDPEALIEIEGFKFRGYIEKIYQSTYSKGHRCRTYAGAECDDPMDDEIITKLAIAPFPGWELG